MCPQESILQRKPVPAFLICIRGIKRRIIPILQLIHQDLKAQKRSIPVPVMVGSVEILPALFSVLRHIGPQIQGIHALLREQCKKMIPGIILVIVKRLGQEIPLQVLLHRCQDKEQRNIHCLQILIQLLNGIREICLQHFIRRLRKGLAPIIHHAVVHEHGLIVCPASGQPCKQSVVVDKVASPPKLRRNIVFGDFLCHLFEGLFPHKKRQGRPCRQFDIHRCHEQDKCAEADRDH